MTRRELDAFDKSSRCNAADMVRDVRDVNNTPGASSKLEFRVVSGKALAAGGSKPAASAQGHLLWDHGGRFLLAERRKPPGFPTVIPDGSRRAATK